MKWRHRIWLMDVSWQNQTSRLCCFVDTTSFVLLSTGVMSSFESFSQAGFLWWSQWCGTAACFSMFCSEHLNCLVGQSTSFLNSSLGLGLSFGASFSLQISLGTAALHFWCAVVSSFTLFQVTGGTEARALLTFAFLQNTANVEVGIALIPPQRGKNTSLTNRSNTLAHQQICRRLWQLVKVPLVAIWNMPLRNNVKMVFKAKQCRCSNLGWLSLRWE